MQYVFAIKIFLRAVRLTTAPPPLSRICRSSSDGATNPPKRSTPASCKRQKAYQQSSDGESQVYGNGVANLFVLVGKIALKLPVVGEGLYAGILANGQRYSLCWVTSLCLFLGISFKKHWLFENSQCFSKNSHWLFSNTQCFSNDTPPLPTNSWLTVVYKHHLTTIKLRLLRQRPHSREFRTAVWHHASVTGQLFRWLLLPVSLRFSGWVDFWAMFLTSPSCPDRFSIPSVKETYTFNWKMSVFPHQ